MDKLIKSKSDEDGFTLIEILVVILIIGILAAIAVPVFLNQRKSAADAAARSDGRNVETAIQTYISSQKERLHINATAIKPYLTSGTGSSVSAGTRVAVAGYSDDWCILVENKNSNLYSWGTEKAFLYYNSRKGGWQDNSVLWFDDNCMTTTGVNWTYLQ